ncbi:MAG: hypothetical protein M1831_006043 [Alyxoria varia]|nr:MAG: hypothetical protein M1831_006043 [Alyxoria varia]
MNHREHDGSEQATSQYSLVPILSSATETEREIMLDFPCDLTIVSKPYCAPANAEPESFELHKSVLAKQSRVFDEAFLSRISRLRINYKSQTSQIRHDCPGDPQYIRRMVQLLYNKDYLTAAGTEYNYGHLHDLDELYPDGDASIFVQDAIDHANMYGLGDHFQMLRLKRYAIQLFFNATYADDSLEQAPAEELVRLVRTVCTTTPGTDHALRMRLADALAFLVDHFAGVKEPVPPQLVNEVHMYPEFRQELAGALRRARHTRYRMFKDVGEAEKVGKNDFCGCKECEQAYAQAHPRARPVKVENHWHTVSDVDCDDEDMVEQRELIEKRELVMEAEHTFKEMDRMTLEDYEQSVSITNTDRPSNPAVQGSDQPVIDTSDLAAVQDLDEMVLD